MLSEERKAAERLFFRAGGAIVIVLSLIWLLPIAWDKLSIFFIAIPIAAMLQPVVRFFDQKLKVKRGITALVLDLILLAIFIWLIIWAVETVVEMFSNNGDQIVNVIDNAVTTTTDAINSLKEYTKDMSPEIQYFINEDIIGGMGKSLADYGMELTTKVTDSIRKIATGIPSFVIYTSFLATTLFFITRDYDVIRSYLPGGSRRRQDSNTTKLTNSAVKSLIGYLKVQTFFALMVLVVSLIYLNALHFQYASVIAAVAGFLEMIPMIGAGLLYIVMGIVFILTGSTEAGIQVLLLTGFLQLVRKILEPKIMSNSMKITPLESLVGMFVGMRVGGILGLIGGPVAMSVLVGFCRGPSYESFKNDIRCIQLYFHNRWQSPAVSDSETDSQNDSDATAIPNTGSVQEAGPLPSPEAVSASEADATPETPSKIANLLRKKNTK